MPVLEVPELDQQHGGLQLVDAEVPTDQRVVVLRLHAVHAQHAKLCGKRVIVRHAHARIAEGAEILGREERQAADVANAAGSAPRRVFRADRLGGILDERQIVPACKRHQRIHVGRLAVQMYRHDRAHATARLAVVQAAGAPFAALFQELANQLHVDVEARRLDVEEYRPRADARDRAAGREKGVRAGDHLVADADVERHQRDEERVRA